MVVGLVEMEPQWFHCSFVGDVVEVTLETVHESPLGLAHILFTACKARDAVDEIVAFAADVDHGRVGASGGGASDTPRGV